MGQALTILHTSDWQCGRPFLPRAADALVRLAARLAPDVVVVSGDLTQRAKVREYRQAVGILDRLPDVPIVTTPGNHDVPLYRIWERLFAPFRNWRRFVSEELDSVTGVEGATFVALGSAAPRRAIVNGRLSEGQLDFAARAFAAAPPADVRCLVVHHHFVPVPGGEGGPPMPRARRWLERIEMSGADLVLGGHVHQTHLRTSRDVLGAGDGPGVPILACGTSTSRRGRGRERGRNTVNLVRVADADIEVTTYGRGPEDEDFEVSASAHYRRRRSDRGHVGAAGGAA